MNSWGVWSSRLVWLSTELLWLKYVAPGWCGAEDGGKFSYILCRWSPWSTKWGRLVVQRMVSSKMVWLFIEYSDGNNRSCFHRAVQDAYAQAGPVNYDGSIGHSAFAEQTFPDENFILRHTGPGILSMVNSGPDTNTSSFFLSFAMVRARADAPTWLIMWPTDRLAGSQTCCVWKGDFGPKCRFCNRTSR